MHALPYYSDRRLRWVPRTRCLAKTKNIKNMSCSGHNAALFAIKRKTVEKERFACMKKIRIPERWQKSKIVDTVSVYVIGTEVTRAIGKKSRAKTSEARGYEAQLMGQKRERKVAVNARALCFFAFMPLNRNVKDYQSFH